MITYWSQSIQFHFIYVSDNRFPDNCFVELLFAPTLEQSDEAQQGMNSFHFILFVLFYEFFKIRCWYQTTTNVDNLMVMMYNGNNFSYGSGEKLD